MKILWICGLPKQVQLEALGGQNYGAHAAWSWILGHLPPHDVELHIACPCTKIRAPMSFEYCGAQFHLVPCVPGRLQLGFLFDPWLFLSLYLKVKPDVVHGWGTEDSYSITAKFLAPRRHVVQVQGLINAYLEHLPVRKSYKYVAFRERQTLKKAKTVFVESNFSGEITKPYCGRQTRIVQVDHPLRGKFLETPPATGREKGILFVGALCDRKGYSDAVRAFSSIADSNWKLTVVGGGDQAEIINLQSLISAFPNISHIPHATSDEIVALMQRSSIFLLPSKMDTGPTALKEALSMGLWPVCYDNSGPQEYITRFQYGSLAKTGDVADLSVVLSWAMQDRPWLEWDRRSAVIEQVRHELCAATIWKQLLTHYEKIITQG